MSDYNQWSTVKALIGKPAAGLDWMSKEDQDRVRAYEKYDQMYWNDPRQYALRVLEGEQPLYIPNARTVVDTTAYFLLKDLKITTENVTMKPLLDAFLKREAFYSRFHTAKHAGVGRGDWVFHLTANPNKPQGTRLSLNSVHPGSVFPIWDEDEPGRMIGCHIAVQYFPSEEELERDPKKREKTYIRRLTYRLEQPNILTRRVSREEAIFELEPSGLFQGEKVKKVKTLIPYGLLDERITVIPIYWFRNRHWDGEDYGSSEMRGLESIAQQISQQDTDVSAALSLEGLGVYATDGGRPLDDDDQETEWEVAPGKVMEVPSGAYFRRVEGVSSITPAAEQIKYMEDKLHEATGLSEVALGKVDAQTASSGIALAIKFMPTLAKLEARDQHAIDVLTQMFYDWKTWYMVFERVPLEGDIVPTIGQKLPTDRVAMINELNNMADRKVISHAYYRQKMEELGYKFPADMEKQILDEQVMAAEAARVAFENSAQGQQQQQNSQAGGRPGTGSTLPKPGNGSNNRNRPNESGGTEAQNRSRDSAK